METFGERLRRLRLAKRMSVEDVAQHISVTHSVVRRAENDEQMIRAWRLPIVARALGVTTDYLLTGRETPKLAALHHAIRSNATRDQLLAMLPAETANN